MTKRIIWFYINQKSLVKLIKVRQDLVKLVVKRGNTIVKIELLNGNEIVPVNVLCEKTAMRLLQGMLIADFKVIEDDAYPPDSLLRECKLRMTYD
jgi:hypothetical protein